MWILEKRTLGLVIVSLLLVGCAASPTPSTPAPITVPADWQTQLAVAHSYALQMSADPVLDWVQAHPATENWVADPQTPPPLGSTFAFADGAKPDPSTLYVTTVRFTNPPITGTIKTDPSITREISPDKGYAQQRLSMRDAFVTMKLGPQDVYRLTAQEGLAFLGSDRTIAALSIGTLDVQEYHLDQLITPKPGQSTPRLVWVAVYRKPTQVLRIFLDPYTGGLLRHSIDPD